ncbi:MAG: protein phosphatase 2C domain-containing protein [Mariprofundaceae bacterium]|nr:protein phosphatase 2C domain-containing protein [Mariprofundaceae bacterium]
MIIIPGSAQCLGQRQEQEDSFGFSDFDNHELIAHAGNVAVVADGMGGLKYGREASQSALQTFMQSYREKKESDDIPARLLKGLFKANRAVSQLALETHDEGEVGTTLVAAVIHQDLLYWASVGDSRLYLYRHNHLKQLTHDHTYAKELNLEVAMGVISNKEASQHPSKNALTSYVGMKKLLLIDCNSEPFKLEEGDRLILCSDGLYGRLDQQHMISCMRESAQMTADKLMAMVVACRDLHQDNATVAILDYLEEPEEVPLTLMQKIKKRVWKRSEV